MVGQRKFVIPRPFDSLKVGLVGLGLLEGVLGFNAAVSESSVPSTLIIV
jgi:hypothetical protein